MKKVVSILSCTQAVLINNVSSEMIPIGDPVDAKIQKLALKSNPEFTGYSIAQI
jgi:hypothetical protein